MESDEKKQPQKKKEIENHDHKRRAHGKFLLNWVHSCTQPLPCGLTGGVHLNITEKPLKPYVDLTPFCTATKVFFSLVLLLFLSRPSLVLLFFSCPSLVLLFFFLVVLLLIKIKIKIKIRIKIKKHLKNSHKGRSVRVRFLQFVPLWNTSSRKQRD